MDGECTVKAQTQQRHKVLSETDRKNKFLFFIGLIIITHIIMLGRVGNINTSTLERNPPKPIADTIPVSPLTFQFTDFFIRKTRPTHNTVLCYYQCWSAGEIHSLILLGGLSSQHLCLGFSFATHVNTCVFSNHKISVTFEIISSISSLRPLSGSTFHLSFPVHEYFHFWLEELLMITIMIIVIIPGLQIIHSKEKWKLMVMVFVLDNWTISAFPHHR